jgi:uncharacterized protein with HEPN domain
MYDKTLVDEIIAQSIDAVGKIIRRFEGIGTPGDFINTDAGKDKLDGICMMLIAIGESMKQLDRITDGKLLSKYPEFDWRGVKSVRDVISHHYFDLDEEIVFLICQKQVPELRTVLERLKKDLP